LIPKADGRQRPLGVAALEDKILERAVVEVLNAIYECDFLGFSYVVRPGRSQHRALDALAVGIEKRRVSWILDADIRDYFSSLDHSWLERFLEHRIADRRVLRLMQKWLRRGHRGREVVGDVAGNAARRVGIDVACERIPAPVRPVGPPVAWSSGAWRGDCRALRR
jgi:hypothetical protein